MKTHRIFPTVLTEFSYDISKEEESTVHKEFDRFEYRPDVFPINTITDLHIHIPQFTKFILDTSDTILTNTFRYDYDSTDLPQPDSPTTAKNSPLFILKLILSTAFTEAFFNSNVTLKFKTSNKTSLLYFFIFDTDIKNP